jgi:hypothetical protein
MHRAITNRPASLERPFSPLFIGRTELRLHRQTPLDEPPQPPPASLLQSFLHRVHFLDNQTRVRHAQVTTNGVPRTSLALVMVEAKAIRVGEEILPDLLPDCGKRPGAKRRRNGRACGRQYLRSAICASWHCRRETRSNNILDRICFPLDRAPCLDRITPDAGSRERHH